MIDKGAMTAKKLVSAAIIDSNAETKKSVDRWFVRFVSPIRTLYEFVQLAKRNGRGLWLIPMMSVLFLVASLLVVIQVIEYVAPFVYTIF